MLLTGVGYEVIKGKARETETEAERQRERERERERKSVCLMKEGGRSEMTSRGAHGRNRGTYR